MNRWDWLGLPGLSNLAGPVQLYRSAILSAWRGKVAAELCAFGRAPCWILLVRISSSIPLMSVRGIRRFCVVSCMVGGVWNGFLLGKVRGEAVPCRFCGGLDGDGHLFWECLYSPLIEIRENPEFDDLMRMDESQWPRRLLWHGWLLLLSGTGGGPPRAASADDAAVNMLESALGACPSDTLQGWDVPQGVDWDSAADRTPPSPDVWTDGCLVRDEVSGSAFAGAGVYARLHVDTWRYRLWGQFDDVGLTPDGLDSSCVGFSSLPGPLQDCSGS